MSGSWSNAANWSAANVPNTPAESAVLGLAGAYTTTFDLGGTTEVQSISITNPLATLLVAGPNTSTSRTLLVDSDVVNQGTIRIGRGDGSGLATMRFTQYASITGTGSIVLEEQGGAVLACTNFTHVTLGAGQKVSGAGTLAAPPVWGFRVHGWISADVPGSELRVENAYLEPGAVVQAVNGGILRFIEGLNGPGRTVQALANSELVLAGPLDCTSGAVCTADGGTVTLDQGYSDGQLLRSINGGKIRVKAGSHGTIRGSVDGLLLVEAPASDTSTTTVNLDLHTGYDTSHIIRVMGGPGSGDAVVELGGFGGYTGLLGSGELRLEEAEDTVLSVYRDSTIEPDYRLTGIGLVVGNGDAVLNNFGTVAPGLPLGTLDCRVLNQGSTGAIEIELGGEDSSLRDRIVNGGTRPLALGRRPRGKAGERVYPSAVHRLRGDRRAVHRNVRIAPFPEAPQRRHAGPVRGRRGPHRVRRPRLRRLGLRGSRGLHRVCRGI